MISMEGEYVEFANKFEPGSDQVEIWLKRLEHCMRQTLESHIHKAVRAAENALNKKDEESRMVRMDWMKHFCAQVALLSVQIIWTKNVLSAF